MACRRSRLDPSSGSDVPTVAAAPRRHLPDRGAAVNALWERLAVSIPQDHRHCLIEPVLTPENLLEWEETQIDGMTDECPERIVIGDDPCLNSATRKHRSAARRPLKSGE